MLSTKISPKRGFGMRRLPLVASPADKVQKRVQIGSSPLASRSRRTRIKTAASREGDGGKKSLTQRSGVAQAIGGTLPLRHVLRDDAGGFHRGLAELGIAGNLALDALALGMQEVAQALELGD